MFNVEAVQNFFQTHVKAISSETFGWLAVLFIHGATIPPMISLLLGVSDRLPTIDVILFLWTGLLLLFVKALVNKDMLNIVTIGGGFVIQAGLLALLVFK
jgi:hypothetical protein